MIDTRRTILLIMQRLSCGSMSLTNGFLSAIILSISTNSRRNSRQLLARLISPKLTHMSTSTSGLPTFATCRLECVAQQLRKLSLAVPESMRVSPYACSTFLEYFGSGLTVRPPITKHLAMASPDACNARMETLLH